MIFQADFAAYVGGVALALIATIFFNWAPLIMKQALTGMEEIKASNMLKSVKAMLTNKRWLIGMVVSVIGGVFYFLALDIAGITVVQPLLNFGFIVLVIAAKRMLGEEVDTRAKVAIGLLIAMPLFMTLSAVTEPQNITSYENVILFSVVCVVLIAGFAVVSKKVAILWALTCGVSLGISAIFMQWFTTQFFISIETTGNLIGSFFGAAFLPFSISMVGNIIANFVFMQIGLQKNAASRYNPINGTVNMIVAIIGGILLFGQGVGNWFYYSIGIGIGVAGIVLLSRYQVEMNSQKLQKTTTKPAPTISKEEDRLKLLQQIIKVSDRLSVSRFAELLDMDPKDVWKKIVSWAEKFSFRIDGEELIFKKETVDAFIASLDQEFRKWGKEGKV